MKTILLLSVLSFLSCSSSQLTGMMDSLNEASKRAELTRKQDAAKKRATWVKAYCNERKAFKLGKADGVKKISKRSKLFSSRCRKATLVESYHEGYDYSVSQRAKRSALKRVRSKISKIKSTRDGTSLRRVSSESSMLKPVGQESQVKPILKEVSSSKLKKL